MMSKPTLFLILNVKRRNGEERSRVPGDKLNKYVRLGFLLKAIML